MPSLNSWDSDPFWTPKQLGLPLQKPIDSFKQFNDAYKLIHSYLCLFASTLKSPMQTYYTTPADIDLNSSRLDLLCQIPHEERNHGQY